MSNAGPIADERRITQALNVFFPGEAWTIETLKGDGSNRRYARLRSGERKAVAMVLPIATGGQSEEAGSEQAAAELPFVNIARYLAPHDFPVPHLFGYDTTADVVLLEDLGNRHLADLFLDTGVPEDRYSEALDVLLRFQCLHGESADCLMFGREYDAELWRWEFEHFREYGAERRSGRELPTSDRQELDRLFRVLAKRIACLPRVPVHRDYHCRNLMIDAHGRLRWIDFQDALMGPALYDVASLLYDAYVDIPDAVRKQLFERYATAAEGEGLVLSDDPELDLDLLAVQRMLKAAGRFVQFEQVKGLQGYTQHIPELLRRSREIIQARRQALPELGTLYDIQQTLVPEWQA